MRGYWRRLSGPLLDRIDLAVRVEAVDLDELIGGERRGEPSAAVRQRVTAARRAQRRRLRRLGAGDEAGVTTNAAPPGQLLPDACKLTAAQRRDALERAEKLRVSARGWHRILRVARTIADLDGRERIRDSELAEAFQYRQSAAELAAEAASCEIT